MDDGHVLGMGPVPLSQLHTTSHTAEDSQRSPGEKCRISAGRAPVRRRHDQTLFRVGRRALDVTLPALMLDEHHWECAAPAAEGPLTAPNTRL